MRVVLLSLITLVLTACSKPYDKYVGYWQLEDTKYPKILEIRKEDKDTYLVNENIFQTTDLLGKSKKSNRIFSSRTLLGFLTPPLPLYIILLIFLRGSNLSLISPFE